MTNEPPTGDAARATSAAERLTSLDVIRGVAVLGILTMNVVSFALPDEAYANVGTPETQKTLDLLVGLVGEILFDQKAMGIFSMLFGAGVLLFADRAAAKGARVVALSLWRNALLLGIGILHSLVWAGDILTVYALCSPVILLVRRWPASWLFTAGIVVLLASPLAAVATQASLPASGEGLGGYWDASDKYSDAVDVWALVDYFGRALGMMLIGAAAFRVGFLGGGWDSARYRRLAAWTLPLGIGLATLGVVVVLAADFDASVAVIGTVPNTLGTLPLVVGYIAVITLLHERYLDRPLDLRLRAVGRMALTNYLAQTAISAVVFWILLDGFELGRAALLVYVLAGVGAPSCGGHPGGWHASARGRSSGSGARPPTAACRHGRRHGRGRRRLRCRRLDGIGSEDEMGGAQQQAAIWGGAPDDWTTLQEPNHIPLWNAMLDALEVGAGSRVLDAACGGGGSSVLIAERGAEVEGIDVTPALIELARQRVPAGTFVVGDIEALPQADGTFDAVLAANAVQFSVDREATVRGFARVCREGGRVAIGNFGPPDDVAFTEVLGAVRSVLPGADTTRQPLDLSAPGRQEALIDAADSAAA